MQRQDPTMHSGGYKALPGQSVKTGSACSWQGSAWLAVVKAGTSEARQVFVQIASPKR